MLHIVDYSDKYSHNIVPLLQDLGYPTTEAKLKKRMEHIQEQQNHYTSLLMENDEVVGMIGYKWFYYYEADEPAGQIMLLVVKQAVQNKGYGRLLLKYAERKLKELGVGAIVINSGNKKEREHAHYFYQKQGYQYTGKRFVKTFS